MRVQERLTVDLSAHPDLVVVYLGMRVNRIRGVARLLGLGPKIAKSWRDKPDGLLLHEDLIWSLKPPHLGMRQYWRDQESLEAWSRSGAHREWWTQFLRDTGGTGFWHEAYHLRGGIDCVYDDLAKPSGLGRVAPLVDARGAMFSSRGRAGLGGDVPAPVLAETEVYAD